MEKHANILFDSIEFKSEYEEKIIKYYFNKITYDFDTFLYLSPCLLRIIRLILYNELPVIIKYKQLLIDLIDINDISKKLIIMRNETIPELKKQFSSIDIESEILSLFCTNYVTFLAEKIVYEPEKVNRILKLKKLNNDNSI